MNLSEAKVALRICEARISLCELTETIQDPAYQRASQMAKNAGTHAEKQTAHMAASKAAKAAGDPRRAKLHIRAANAAGVISSSNDGETKKAIAKKKEADAVTPNTWRTRSYSLQNIP